MTLLICYDSNMKKQCQSCGMPLDSKLGDMRGTEKNGIKNPTYCKLCYAEGAFTGPDCTLDQMIAIVDDALKDNGWSAPKRWLAKKQIPHLARWKTNK